MPKKRRCVYLRPSVTATQTVNCITPAVSRTHGIGSQRSMKAERSDNGITSQDILDVFPGARIVAKDKPPPVATIAVSHPDTYPPSVRICDGNIVTDVPKFVATTISELERYVTAVNAGRSS